MKKEEEKTNVMRILDQKKVKYTPHSYDPEQAVSGVEVAAVLRQDEERVFKTLVTTGKTGNHYVFVIPVAEELDLKKAAKAVGEKTVDMIHVKDITKITGYVRGGCSPLGMKKPYPVVFDASAGNFSEIYVSGGRIGLTLKVPLEELLKVTGGKLADITMKSED